MVPRPLTDVPFLVGDPFRLGEEDRVPDFGPSEEQYPTRFGRERRITVTPIREPYRLSTGEEALSPNLLPPPQLFLFIVDYMCLDIGALGQDT